MNQINYQYLNSERVEEIHTCFLESFSDYHVDMSYLTLDRMISRARMDRVDYNYSVGAFDGDRMIGFLIVAIDEFNNKKSAFDAGTGVIKDYRGKGIAGKMFDFALKKLSELSIEQFVLEVIQENEGGINAYKKAGFEISRELDCYKLDLNEFSYVKNNGVHFSCKTLQKEDLKDCMHFTDFVIPWEYTLSAINNINEELIIKGAFIQDKCVGYIIYYPTLEWVFQLSVNLNFRSIGIGSFLMNELMNEIRSKANTIKFNCIQVGSSLGEFLEAMGFKIYIKQYEMIRSHI